MISSVTRLPAGNRGICIWVILSEFGKGTICKSSGRCIEIKREQLLASGDKQGGPSGKCCDLQTCVLWQPHRMEVEEQILWLLFFFSSTLLLGLPDEQKTAGSQTSQPPRTQDRAEKGRDGFWETQGRDPPQVIISSRRIRELCPLCGFPNYELVFGLSLL